jgi:L-threonylcarbamoyladenylate synthase
MSYYLLTFANLQPLDPRQVPMVRVSGADGQVPRRAVEALRQGQVIVYPTDTVYGVGCRIDDEGAVRRIYQIKGRPATEPLPILLADPAQLETYVRGISAAARRLSGRFWPGALTLIFRRSERISPVVAGGGDTVAVRVSAHPIPRALVRTLGIPIVGTSANSHGMRAPLTAQLAIYDLGDRVDLVLDGGRTTLGRESTVVDVTGEAPRVVREGALSARELGLQTP